MLVSVDDMAPRKAPAAPAVVPSSRGSGRVQKPSRILREEARIAREEAQAVDFPQLSWTSDDNALTSELFNVLDDFPSIRRGLWPREREIIPRSEQGKTKTIWYQELAVVLLEHRDLFRPYLFTVDNEPNKSGRVYYGTVVKNRVMRLVAIYKKAKEKLGVTGGGTITEEDVNRPDHQLYDTWKEVKKTCPFFWKMRELTSERFDDVPEAITNSRARLDNNLMLPRRNDPDAREMTEGNESDDELTPGTGAMDDANDDGDEEDILRDDLDATQGRPRPPADPPQPSQIPSSQAAVVPSQNQISRQNNVSTPTPRRRPAGAFAEWTNGFVTTISTQSDNKKAAALAREDNRRLEIESRERVDTMRVNFERELAKEKLILEQRRLRIDEARYGLPPHPEPLAGGFGDGLLNGGIDFGLS